MQQVKDDFLTLVMNKINDLMQKYQATPCSLSPLFVVHMYVENIQ